MGNIINFLIGADNAQFKKAAEEIRTEAKKTGNAVDKLGNDGKKSAGMLKGAFAGLGDLIPAITIGGIINFGRSLIDMAGNLQDSADRARTSVEAYQVLATAAAEAGVSQGQLTTALVTLQDKVEAAAGGSDEAAKAFTRLGVSYQDFAGLTPERQFELLGKSIVGAKDQNEAFAAAMDIIGSKNAPRLLGILKELGADGFDAMAESARRSGEVVDKYAVGLLDKWGDRLGRFGVKFKSFFAEELAGALSYFDGEEGAAFRARQDERRFNGGKGPATAAKEKQEAEERAKAKADADLKAEKKVLDEREKTTDLIKQQIAEAEKKSRIEAMGAADRLRAVKQEKELQMAIAEDVTKSSKEREEAAKKVIDLMREEKSTRAEIARDDERAANEKKRESEKAEREQARVSKGSVASSALDKMGGLEALAPVVTKTERGEIITRREGDRIVTETYDRNSIFGTPSVQTFKAPDALLTEAIEKQYTMQVERLDRQITLLEKVVINGSKLVGGGEKP